MTPKIIGISILAGLISAFCMVSAQSLGLVGAFLILFASLPIYFAAVSFGTHAGVASSIVTIVVTASIASPSTAIVAGLIFTIPASIIGHQSNLAQPLEDGTMEWYPLPKLFFNLCIWLIIGCIAAAYIGGNVSEANGQELRLALTAALKQNPQLGQMSEQELVSFVEYFLKIIPFIFPALWLTIHLANYQIATSISRSANLMPRPKDDISATLNLPKIMIAIGVGSLVISVMAGGTLQAIASVIAGVSIMALALVGLADMRLKAKNNTFLYVMLILSYMAILLFLFPIFIFAAGGIVRVFNNNQHITPEPGN